MRGIRRQHGTAQRRVASATTGVVQAMAATCDQSLTGRRDRALLLLGFAAALRRSELVALDVTDIAVVAEGLRISIRRSKMDQDGAGGIIGVVRTGTPTCPVAAGIKAGRVFRRVVGAALSDQSVALLVKKRARVVGLEGDDFSGHSLRAGLATTAAAASGVEERIIQRQTRHRSVTVLRGYIRTGEVFTGNASGRYLANLQSLQAV